MVYLGPSKHQPFPSVQNREYAAADMFCFDPTKLACREFVYFVPPILDYCQKFQKQISNFDSDSDFYFLVGKHQSVWQLTVHWGKAKQQWTVTEQWLLSLNGSCALQFVTVPTTPYCIFDSNAEWHLPFILALPCHLSYCKEKNEFLGLCLCHVLN